MSGFVIAKLGACAALGTEASGIQAEVLAGTSAFEHQLGPRGAVTVAALETLPAETATSASRRRTLLLEHALADLLDGLAWSPGRLALVHAEAADHGSELMDLVGRRAHELGQQIVATRTSRHGRAGWFMAMLHAEELLREGACESVLVFASDSRCDRETVAALARAREVLCEENRDGLVPGEGACVALCCLPNTSLSSLPTAMLCERVAVGREPNPFVGATPNISTGLAALFRSLKLPTDIVIDCQTGQTRFTKEFHAAYLRCIELMPEPLVRATTAASFGDAGVAIGGLAMVLAQLELGTRARALVYASDDEGQLGGAIVTRLGAATALRERLGHLWVQVEQGGQVGQVGQADSGQLPSGSAFHQRDELIEDHLDTCGYRVLDRFDDLTSGQIPWFELVASELRIQAQLDALALGGRSTIDCARAGLRSPSADRRLGSALVAGSWFAAGELNASQAMGREVCELARALDDEELGELAGTLALATNAGPIISAMLCCEWPRVRQLGLELGGGRDDVSVSDMAECLGDAEMMVRGAAAISLARRGASAYTDDLIAAAQAEPECVAYAAALAWLGRPQAIDRLRWLLGQAPASAIESAGYLAMCGTPADMRGIHDRLTQLEPVVAIVEALGSAGWSSSIPYLLRSLEHDDEALRSASARALDRVTGAGLREQLVDGNGVVEVRRCTDPRQWQRWLDQRREPWPAERLRDGQPWTLRRVWNELRAGTSEMMRRRLAADELSLRTAGLAPLDVRAAITRQLRTLSSWGVALGVE